MTRMPLLFISHGAPNLVLHDSPCHRFLQDLGRSLPRPEAVLVVSAHFTTRAPALTADAKPETIYDFGGFEPELYQMTYPAPGAPDVASRCARTLVAHGVQAALVTDRGFDHGTWVPLKLMFPQADIPVFQLSVQPNAGPAHHLAVGKALSELAGQRILIVGSGALTHNLHEFFAGGYGLHDPAPEWVRDFGDWMNARIEAGDTGALVDYRKASATGARNHPTEEHLLPLFTVLGAAGNAPGRRLHSSAQYGVLMMDVYGFGMPEALAA